ncbi:MAG TPA: hypothetical protein VIJ71_05355 [Mycobacteriales bacterium]
MADTNKDTPGARTKPWQRITPKEIAGIVIAVIAVIFIAENGSKTRIRFVGPQVTTHLWLALLVAAVLGFVAGLLVARQHSRS